MKHVLILTVAALALGACSTTHSSNKSVATDTESMTEDVEMMETADETVMSSDDAMTSGDDMSPTATQPTDVETAPPAAAVDCTGLSDDECMAKVMNFGNEPTMAEPAPVEPVEAEEMMDVEDGA